MKLPPTDKLIARLPIPFYKRKYVLGIFAMIVWCTLFMIFKYSLQENPPANVITRITNNRDNLKIQFEPFSLKDELIYSFEKISDSTYRLEIINGYSEHLFEHNYEYGYVSSIISESEQKNRSNFIITFRNLKEEPRVEYTDFSANLNISFNKNLSSKFIVVLDPGHGGDLPGAVGRSGTKEKDVVLDIAKMLKEEFEGDSEFEIILTRDDDSDVSINDRVRMSRFWAPDLFVSIHANSARNRGVNQTEIYYADTRGSEIAKVFRDNLREDINIGPSIIKRRRFAVIRRNPAAIGSVLVEAMYLSNPTGEKLLNCKDQRYIIAQSLYRSIRSIKMQADK
ncbi:N-acetylmuramoyl-L-alanine amidase [candidate division KSB1 bacterium]